MRTTSALWATALAIMSVSGPLLTTADAAPAPQRQVQQQPRYYFPRHIKRQIVTNSSNLDTAPTDPGGGLVLTTTVVMEVTMSSTLTQIPGVAAPTGSQANLSSSSSSLTESSSSPTSTEVILSTAVVTPVPASAVGDSTSGATSSQPLQAAAVGSTGGFPASIVQPSSSSPAASPQNPATESTADTTTDGTTDETTQAAESTDTTAAADSNSVPAVGSTGGIPASVVLPSSSTQAAATQAPSAGLLPALQSIVQPSSSSDAESTDTTAAATATNLLGGVVGSTGLLPSTIVLPTLSSASVAAVSSTPANVPSSSGGILVGLSTILGGPSSASASSTEATTTAAASSSDDGLGVLPLLSSLASDVSSVVSSVAAPTTTETAVPILGSSISLGLTGTGLVTVVPISSILPSDTGLPLTLPSLSDTGILSSIIPTSIPTSIPISIPISSTVISLPSGSGILSSLPISSITISASVPISTPSSLGVYSTPISSGTAVSSSAVIVPTSPASSDSIVVSSTVISSSGPAAISSSAPISSGTGALPSSAIPPTSRSVAVTVASPPPSLSNSAPNSIVPTATDSATTQSVPTAIIIQPSTVSTSATGIPSSMPKVIQPAGGVPTQPKNTTLVQVGYQHELNYGFVSANPQSASQIFTFTPDGISYGLGIGQDDVTMYSIEPYDTSKLYGYITTLCLFYVPSDMVDQLAIDIHTANSGLYNNPDDTVATLMSLIVPSIPLLAGQPLDAASPTGSSSATVSPGSQGGGAPFGGDAGNSSPVSPTAAAIAAPIATGGLLYGAAMIFVARRYKRRRQAHQRTSSVPSTHSGGSGGAWMSGGRARHSHGSGSSNGRSVRTQQISAPVMAENSLGWN